MFKINELMSSTSRTSVMPFMINLNFDNIWSGPRIEGFAMLSQRKSLALGHKLKCIWLFLWSLGAAAVCLVAVLSAARLSVGQPPLLTWSCFLLATTITTTKTKRNTSFNEV